MIAAIVVATGVRFVLDVDTNIQYAYIHIDPCLYIHTYPDHS